MKKLFILISLAFLISPFSLTNAQDLEESDITRGNILYYNYILTNKKSYCTLSELRKESITLRKKCVSFERSLEQLNSQNELIASHYAYFNKIDDNLDNTNTRTALKYGYQIEEGKECPYIYDQKYFCSISEMSDYVNKKNIEETYDEKDFLKQVLEYTNKFRNYYELPLFSQNKIIDSAASNHCEDMAKNDYFEHINLKGESVGERLEKVGYEYEYAWENIATWQPSPNEVVEGWMKSRWHRLNILEERFEEIWLAVCLSENSNKGIFWVQNFWLARN